ncbi:MAG: type II secretion system protein [Alphaproteobacteria bacterium]
MRTHSMKKLIRRISGFTLTEMSLAIMIIGVIVAGAVPLYSQYVQRQDIKKTAENIAQISDAIGAFRLQWGRYPSPASLSAARTDPEYGREQRAVTPPAGSCAPGGGLCAESSVRTGLAFTDRTGTFVPSGTPTIQVGFIPFRQLGLDEEQAYDNYGNRILYAVTDHLAFADGFAPSTGGLDIRGTAAGSILNPPGSAHFFVVSPGRNRAGAYTRAGTQLTCTGSPLELANTTCNIATSPDAVFTAAETSTGSGASAFDDVTTFYTEKDVPLWQLAEANPLHIHQKPKGAIVVGDVLPLPPAGTPGLYTTGVIRAGAVEGRIEAAHLCTDSAVNCFLTQSISGLIADGFGMECPPGRYMQGIAGGAPICTDELLALCDPGEFVTGINPDGTLICSPGGGSPGCSVTPVNVCAQPRSLPAGVDGDEATVTANFPPPDIDVDALYRCNINTWNMVSTSGPCPGCTPETETEPLVCPAGSTGSIERTRTRACAGDPWGPWVITDLCVPGGSSCAAGTDATAGTGGGGNQNQPGNSGPNAEVRYMLVVKHQTDNTYEVAFRLEVTQPNGASLAFSSSSPYLFEIGSLKAEVSGTGVKFYDASNTLIQNNPWTTTSWSSNSYDNSVGWQIYMLGADFTNGVVVPYALFDPTDDVVVNSSIVVAWTGRSSAISYPAAPLNVSVGGRTTNWNVCAPPLGSCTWINQSTSNFNPGPYPVAENADDGSPCPANREGESVWDETGIAGIFDFNTCTCTPTCTPMTFTRICGVAPALTAHSREGICPGGGLTAWEPPINSYPCINQ